MQTSVTAIINEPSHITAVFPSNHLKVLKLLQPLSTKTTTLPGTLIKDLEKDCSTGFPLCFAFGACGGIGFTFSWHFTLWTTKTSRLNSLITHLKNYFSTWFKWDSPVTISLMTLEFQSNKLKSSSTTKHCSERE